MCPFLGTFRKRACSKDIEKIVAENGFILLPQLLRKEGY